MWNAICCPNRHCFFFNVKRIAGMFIKKGNYRRKCDGKLVQRYGCKGCVKTFSAQTFHKNYRLHKPELSAPLSLLLVSGVSQRRAARNLQINRKTVASRVRKLGKEARFRLEIGLRSHVLKGEIQMDEMESFEHTKMKPLSIPLAVDGTRTILGFAVVEMPAKGHLAARSRKKYGRRLDLRPQGFKSVLKGISHLIQHETEIRTDKKPAYGPWIKDVTSKGRHTTTKGRRGAIVGQGELKVGGFDPIFSLNHTAAMLRDNIGRLRRRTWCTTKNPRRLFDLISIYADFHNSVLLKKKQK